MYKTINSWILWRTTPLGRSLTSTIFSSGGSLFMATRLSRQVNNDRRGLWGKILRFNCLLIIYNIPLFFACFRWYRRRLAEFVWTRKSGRYTSNLYSFKCATSSHSQNGISFPGEFSFGLHFLVNESCVILGNAISCWKLHGAFESSEWKPLDVLCRLDLSASSRLKNKI